MSEIAANYKQPFTRTLDGDSFYANFDKGFTAISILCVSGIVLVSGSAVAGGVASNAISVPVGASITMGNATGGTAILDGISIDASSGVALVIAQ